MAFLFLLMLGFILFISGFGIGENAREPWLGWFVSLIGAGVAWMAFRVDGQILDGQAKRNVQSGKYTGSLNKEKNTPSHKTNTYKAGKAIRKKVQSAQEKKSALISSVSQTKFCEYCDERIKKTAKKCKHCGEWVS